MSYFSDIKDCTNDPFTPFKQRCNTLPAKDLARISQIFTSESEYMVMSPRKIVDKSSDKIFTSESIYMPMSPLVSNIKTKIESCYMVMSGKNVKST